MFPDNFYRNDQMSATKTRFEALLLLLHQHVDIDYLRMLRGMMLHFLFYVKYSNVDVATSNVLVLEWKDVLKQYPWIYLLPSYQRCYTMLTTTTAKPSQPTTGQPGMTKIT